MTLIEQLNDLCTEYEGGALALSVVTDLRAIIEQAKREAVEPVAVPSSVMRDALMRSVEVVSPAPHPELARCKSCNGNDYDMPCAYPSEGKHGCLRDARLAHQPDIVAELVKAVEPYYFIKVIGETDWYECTKTQYLRAKNLPEYDYKMSEIFDDELNPLYGFDVYKQAQNNLSAPQPDHTKLIGELVRALDRYSGCTGRLSDEINALLTKAREAIK